MANGELVPYGILESGQNVLDQPYMGINPFAPAGITDATRQGWLTGLEGLAAQYDPAVAYATNMGNLAGYQQDWFGQGMQGGFGWNPYMDEASRMALQSTYQPYLGQAGQMYSSSLDPRLFDLSSGLTLGAMNQPYFGQAAGQIGETLGTYATPGATGAMLEEINQATGGPQIDLGMIDAAASAANRALQRDFDLTTLQNVDLGAIGSGVGGYGSTRAGVAEGIARRGLADAMERQTTEMFMQGMLQGQTLAEQSRQANLDAALQAQQLGGQYGLQGAAGLADIGQAQSSLGLSGAGQIGDIGLGYAGLQQGAGVGLGSLGQAQGNLGMQGALMLGGLGESSLEAMNQMGQWGYGQMLPAAYLGAYQAGLLPGQVMQNMGSALTGIGSQQQMANQGMVDWYNQNLNYMAGYPWQQIGNYQQMIQPYTQPGGVTTSSGGYSPGMGPVQAGMQGAMTGYTFGNMLQPSQQTGSNWLQQQHNVAGASGNFLR